ncbi:hypothetical protein, partial [Rhizobium sp. Root483D2]|uniref:hypothetical protein n=1 Tax=Rhizobium sp. Root483D2 TaxID=1736545 RepID=UPI001AECE831
KDMVEEFTSFASFSPSPEKHALPIELDGVADRVSEGDGFWKSCSGCHELNEGVPTGPYSEIMKCNLGMGCRECGGIGAIWDGTDYSIFGVEPEPVDLTELPDDVRQAAIIAFNTAAEVPHWGGGEPYLIIGRAIMAGRTPSALKSEIIREIQSALEEGAEDIYIFWAGKCRLHVTKDM